MSEGIDAVEVAKIAKSARLEERKLIEEGLDRRLKATHEQQMAIIKLQMK